MKNIPEHFACFDLLAFEQLGGRPNSFPKLLMMNLPKHFACFDLLAFEQLGGRTIISNEQTINQTFKYKFVSTSQCDHGSNMF